MKLVQQSQSKEDDESTLQRVIFSVIDSIDSNTESVPPTYEGMKCFQFEIEKMVKPQ